MDSVYRPLDVELGEIRILHLLPSKSFDDIIQCELLYTRLSDPLEYEGLSYVWGKPEFTKTIELNGSDFHITPNLESALRHLRRSDSNRTIWVDAICINQKDTSERNHQVTLMKQIYEHCTADLAWLLCDTGDEPEADVQENLENMQLGMDLMKRLSAKDGATLDRLRQQYSKQYPRRTVSPKLYLSRLQRWNLQRVFSVPSIWLRIWVMQELACAPRIVLVAGHKTLDWELVDVFLDDTTYTDAFHMAVSHSLKHDRNDIGNTVFYAVKTVQNQRRITQGGGTSSLLDVLARFKNAQATDDRDKIYGLLGLVSEKERVDVDYGKTKAQVFTEAALAIINAEENLDLICQNPFKRAKSKKNDRETGPSPSWTPDFSQHTYKDYDHQFSTLLYGQRGIYRAGKPRCAVPCEVLPGWRLRLQGCQLGRVAQLQDQWTSRTNRTIQEGAEWYQQWMSRYLNPDEESPPYGPTGESMFRAFWRTLVLDGSAYPVQRLTEQQVAGDEELFRQILGLDLALGSTDELHKLFWALASFRMATRVWMRWRFAVSDHGHFIMIAEEVQEGDVITILDGARVPVILRQVGDPTENTYMVKGAAYVHGFMDGEAEQQLAGGKLEYREFLVE